MNGLEKYSHALKKGEIVGFPTETVYGFGVDYQNSVAIAFLNQMKQRPKDKHLTLHCSDIAIASSFFLKQQTQDFYLLCQAFLPGPLMLIMKKSSSVPKWISSTDSVGIRVPSHPVAKTFIELCGGVIAATSANLFSKNPLIDSNQVKRSFPHLKFFISGRSIYNHASTILDISRFPYQIRRQGIISKQKIEAVLKQQICIA